ncbi:MAG: protein kinase, partial [Chlamydiales bacterium]
LIPSLAPLPPQPSRKLLLIGKKPYLIKNELGEGAFGKVYLAVDLVTSQQVAIKYSKISEAEQQEAVQNEIEAYEKRREMTPEARGFISEGELEGMGTYVMVMPLASGQRMDKELFDKTESDQREEKGKLLSCVRKSMSPLSAYLFADQFLSELMRLQSLGIIHRDIKLENLFWDDENKKLVVLDYGDAIHSEKPYPDEYKKPRKEDNVKGTPQYLSPEALLEKLYSVKSDNYAAGLVIAIVFSKFNFLLELQQNKLSGENRLKVLQQMSLKLRSKMAKIGKLQVGVAEPELSKLKRELKVIDVNLRLDQINLERIKLAESELDEKELKEGTEKLEAEEKALKGKLQEIQSDEKGLLAETKLPDLAQQLESVERELRQVETEKDKYTPEQQYLKTHRKLKTALDDVENKTVAIVLRRLLSDDPAQRNLLEANSALNEEAIQYLQKLQIEPGKISPEGITSEQRDQYILNLRLSIFKNEILDFFSKFPDMKSNEVLHKCLNELYDAIYFRKHTGEKSFAEDVVLLRLLVAAEDAISNLSFVKGGKKEHLKKMLARVNPEIEKDPILSFLKLMKDLEKDAKDTKPLNIEIQKALDEIYTLIQESETEFDPEKKLAEIARKITEIELQLQHGDDPRFKRIQVVLNALKKVAAPPEAMTLSRQDLQTSIRAYAGRHKDMRSSPNMKDIFVLIDKMALPETKLQQKDVMLLKARIEQVRKLHGEKDKEEDKEEKKEEGKEEKKEEKKEEGKEEKKEEEKEEKKEEGKEKKDEKKGKKEEKKEKKEKERMEKEKKEKEKKEKKEKEKREKKEKKDMKEGIRELEIPTIPLTEAESKFLRQLETICDKKPELKRADSRALLYPRRASVSRSRVSSISAPTLPVHSASAPSMFQPTVPTGGPPQPSPDPGATPSIAAVSAPQLDVHQPKQASTQHGDMPVGQVPTSETQGRPAPLIQLYHAQAHPQEHQAHSQEPQALAQTHPAHEEETNVSPEAKEAKAKEQDKESSKQDAAAKKGPSQ